MQGALVLVSWNVYRNYRTARIEESMTGIVEMHQPDVILIQEAPVYDGSSFADLGVFEGYSSLYAPIHEIRNPTRTLPFLSTGNLTLARHAWRQSDVLELPHVRLGRKNPAASSNPIRRRALYAQWPLSRGRTLGIYNVHLENRATAGGRRLQMRHLLDWMERRADDVVVVGGDFNTILSHVFERCIRMLEEAGFTNLFADEGLRLLPRRDYLLVRGAAASEGRPLRGRGSDHQPVMAVVSLD